jgi:pimeloyl-ACP methyl ester carboxylesterase
MRLSPTIQPPEEMLEGFINPPTRFATSADENRLIPVLREAAQTMDPSEILARAAEQFYWTQHPSTDPAQQGDAELGNALADLAVTGRNAYQLFQSATLDESALAELTRAKLTPSVQASEADLAAALAPALDRAFAVAWALRGPVSQRAALRAGLGWIAVSGEDDTPHRPVNVPTAPYEYYELPVIMGTHTIQTRFFVASAVEDDAPAPSPPATRALPPDLQPVVPAGHEVILFLHGDCSGAEEALGIIPSLHAAGLEHGKKYSIVSLDLPNNGYSQTFPHTDVAPSSGTSWPGGLDSHTPLKTPILDFIEDFIVAFVNALDSSLPNLYNIKARFAGVIGGSLGGNMGLRLGRRAFTESPLWLNAIVSWSAASVWAPTINDVLKSAAPGRCMIAADAPETPSARAEHFQVIYDKKLDDALLPWTQPETWYWKHWPLKAAHILGSRLGRREIYNMNFRQWHWRLSAEQVIFSHVDFVDREVPNSKRRYELNMVRQLLLAGQDDNYRGANIFDATRSLASFMEKTPGRSIFLRDTGHSIHFERPQYLAAQMVKFFTTSPMEITCIHKKDGRIRSVGGSNSTSGVPFTMTEAECMLSISAGNEFFVKGADGSHGDVYIIAGSDFMYLSTYQDSSQADNLISLPEC